MLIRPLIRYVVVVAATALAAYQASAENFTLQSGDIVEGRIIRALGGTLSIKMPARGMMQVPINAVDRVEIELDSGETIVGRFIGWSRGVYQIDVDGRLLDIAEADGAFTIVAEATTIAAEATPEEDDSDGVGGPRVVLAQEAG
ncbi:MAG: hypothetical protein HC871_14315, partial [Rhizobiales bacterium]|nr:hypothetical protein [Hyphomicrobiales bacterium]